MPSSLPKTEHTPNFITASLHKRKGIYIEKENTEKLSAVEAFTFEPHISLAGFLYWFKKENIYGFNGGRTINKNGEWRNDLQS